MLQGGRGLLAPAQQARPRQREKIDGLVIGSDGGGASYVLGTDGTVHRTRAASLDEPELDKVADDLRHVLELLERSLRRFVANGEPGYL